MQSIKTDRYNNDKTYQNVKTNKYHVFHRIHRLKLQLHKCKIQISLSSVILPDFSLDQFSICGLFHDLVSITLCTLMLSFKETAEMFCTKETNTSERYS